MSEKLGSVYHWSPRDRRAEIIRYGLIAGSESTIASAEIHVVCCGTSPRAAWCLSGNMAWAQDIERWDLWQVFLADTDELYIRSDWGPKIAEVKILNSIPADRIWWIGERGGWKEPIPRVAMPPRPRRTRA